MSESSQLPAGDTGHDTGHNAILDVAGPHTPRTEVSEVSGQDAAVYASQLAAAEQSVLLAARSLLVQRQQFTRMFGFEQFGGNRDIIKVLGYPETLSFGHYQQRYERGGIAKRIVNAAPEAMGWSKLVMVEDDDPKNETPFESACADLFQRLNIGSVLERADILAGIGEYSVIYIGVKEKNSIGDTTILEREMSRLSGPDDIAYLRPISQQFASVTEWVGDSSDDSVSDPRYGLPKFYNIQITGARRSITGIGGPTAGKLRRVHHSRIIHVTHSPLDSEIFSAPELQACWNYLCDLDKLVGGGAEATWKEAVNRTLFDLDKDIGPDGGSILSTAAIDPANVEKFNTSKEKLKEQLEELENNLRKYMLTRGVTPKTITGKVVNFENNVRTLLSLIASIYNVPQRILFGAEAGHLASTQDADSWNSFKANRQNKFGVVLARDMFDRFIKYGALPKPKQYAPKWPTEEELNEPQKASLVNTLALANRNQFAADGTIIVTNNEIREMAYPDRDPLPEPESEPTPIVIAPSGGVGVAPPTSAADSSKPEIMPPAVEGAPNAA